MILYLIKLEILVSVKLNYKIFGFEAIKNV